MKRWTIWVSNDKIVGSGEERPTRLIACEPIEVAPASEVERLREAVEVAMRRYRDNKTHDREFVAELDAALHPDPG